MKKAEAKFYRDKKQQIDRDSTQNEGFFFRSASHSPIFIPKRKKKK